MLSQPGGEFTGDVLPVGGGRPGADDRGGPVVNLVEALRPDHPQRQRRDTGRFGPQVGTGEGRERQPRPLVVVGCDEPATAPIQHLEVCCSRVEFAPGGGSLGQRR